MSAQSSFNERGVPYALKDAILNRFPLFQKTFNQAAFVESLNLPQQVLADIWLPVAFPPVSFEPFSETEEKAIETGTFTFSGRAPAGRNQGDYHNRRNNQMSTGGYQQNQQQRPGQQRRNYQQQGQPQSGQQQQQQSRFNNRFGNRSQEGYHHENDDDMIEDPDNLWATPSADAVGSGDFGSFDENGIFRAAGAASDFSMPPLRPEEFGFPARQKPVVPEPLVPTTSSLNASSFFFSSPPGVQAPQVPAPAAPTTAIPYITPETQWLYRDPSGHVQGPFISTRMLEWYNGNYFPESLPLRREQDPFFEPLSVWKMKCANQVPFAAYTQKKPEPPAAPALSPRVAFASASSAATVDDWFTPESKPILSKPAAPEAATRNASRSVAIASLFGNVSSSSNSASTPSVSAAQIEKPGSPEVMMPSASAWKKPTSVSAVSFGSIESQMTQMALAEKVEKAEKAEKVEKVTSTVPTEKPKPMTAEAVEAKAEVKATSVNQLPQSSSWGTSSLKKISLNDILKEEPVVTEIESHPLPVAPQPLSPSTSAGWAKIPSSPVQPLSAIQAEEARRESERRQSQPASSSGSKSFADLVRSAGVVGGNVLVTASQSPAPVVTAPVSVPVVRKPELTKPVKAAEIAPQPAKPQSVSEWCQSSLAKTPLAKLIDPLTCTTLLLDLPNPAAILGFSLDTLQPLLASSKESFDLAGFSAELASRKFGKDASAKINWSRLTIMTSNASAPTTSDFSFETVKRKKK